MPAPSSQDGEVAKGLAGQGVVDPEDVRRLLAASGLETQQYRLEVGLFEETFMHDLPESVCLLHIDADWYASVLLCLRTFYDRVVEGGVIVLDDFTFWEGCREAFYDFVEERHLRPVVERHGHSQMYWFKGKTTNRFPGITPAFPGH
jgi:O-methyltransferase